MQSCAQRRKILNTGDASVFCKKDADQAVPASMSLLAFDGLDVEAFASRDEILEDDAHVRLLDRHHILAARGLCGLLSGSQHTSKRAAAVCFGKAAFGVIWSAPIVPLSMSLSARQMAALSSLAPPLP